MSLRRVIAFLRWSARLLALLNAGAFFVFLFGEAFDPRGTHPSAWEAALLALLIVAALALLLAWRWERLAGITAATLGSIFFLYCALTPGMHKVWFLGVALAVPGFLFAMAGQLNRKHSQGR